jgi:hypothetical protein
MKLSEMFGNTSWKLQPVGMTATEKLADAVQGLIKKYELDQAEADVTDLVERLHDFKGRLETDNWTNYPWHKAASLMRDFFCSDLLEASEWRCVADALLSSLEISEKKSFLKAAIDVYFIKYSSANKQVARLSETLAKRNKRELPLSNFLKEEIEIFNRNAAHNQLGKFLANSEKPYDVLQKNGVPSPHMPGLFEQSFLSMLSSLQQDLDHLQRDAFDKIMNWMAPNSSIIARHQLNHGIEALLLPFEEHSDKDLQEIILRFCIENFKDPRVNKAKWNGVSSKALKIISKWLTTKSLLVFFEIINRFQDSHMWEPRKKFWSKINDDNLIDNAWVVLSKQGTLWARQIADKNEDPSFRSHGQIADISEEKCFFIMQIGDLTIVEGTHNFKLRIFKKGNLHTPDLYKTGSSSYYRDDLTVSPKICDESFIHDKTGHWRNKTVNFIRRNA